MQSRQQHLYAQLGAVTGDVEELHRWRSDVRHDARNTCAGLRAALNLLYDPGSELRPGVAQRLRDAAVFELQNLEDLLTSPESGGGTFELDEALRSAVGPQLRVGASVRLHGRPGRVQGRADDLVLVVRELMMRSFGEVARNEVTILVSLLPGTALVEYAEAKPVVTSPGAEDDLRAVRHLVRRQGGDLRWRTEAEGHVLELRCRLAPDHEPVPTPIGVDDLADRVSEPA